MRFLGRAVPDPRAAAWGWLRGGRAEEHAIVVLGRAVRQATKGVEFAADEKQGVLIRKAGDLAGV